MFQHFGVRGRLLLSFVGISGFAVLATAAAMYSFLEVQTLLDKVTEQKVPTALGAQELSARVERIVAETPTLLAANTTDERLEIWGRLGTEVEGIDTLLLMLPNRGFPSDALVSLQNVLNPLRSNLLSLNTLADERIALADRKAILLEGMRKANDDTLAVLGPWITNVSNDVPRLRAVVDNSSVSAEERSTAETELIASLTLLASLQQTLQEVGEAHESLVGTAFAETHDRLNLLTLRAQWLVESLDTLGQVVGAQPRQLVLAEVERFRQLTDGENNAPSLRARELTLLATGEELRRENARLSRELTASVHLLVRGTKLDISQATSRARTVQRRSSITLILIVSLSLASSVLIVWLYVNRNLVARLTGLSDSMLAIAGGNLKAILPPTGSDEIGRMAAALTVFRDTAAEVEEQNLREIAAARKRLIDAIESISEGFSLYDADDQLVVCNSTYKQLMYPGIKDVVKPGVSFETIIREAAARGLIRDAEGRVEEWVAERLARHRSPGEPHLQGRSDGRWILISERKTDDGGTVAVYADITELKHREDELAEKSNALEQKSNALEQLSKQLAKYLSPQVYDSIFSGKQEVKVASSRKKLTIFFSDIVGFTETADRLESEELTQVLNHYLTEMSRIALDHGATVDKFVGDAILIFFGDPETKGVKEDALACVSMAIAMREKLHSLEDIWRESGINKPLQVRMGIHTGFCTVGNFGSEDRMDYTIIGGAVNTASRLESLATPGEILISYETFAHVRDQIYCEGHGEAEVKGIAYPVATYQVVDSHENLNRERRHFCEEHPNVRVDLDFDSMTSDDRGQAEKILHRALDLLSQFKKPAKRRKL
ncbi:PAS-domain containing protein [Gammaproteobacteria bacterium]|nr:PAS-domain containing protein [Gammaproteobacteria bacterium]